MASALDSSSVSSVDIDCLPSGFCSATDTDLSSDEEELREARDAVKLQNRKKKKSGGFQSMGLSHAVLKGVLKKGYKVPTPIQRKCVPLIMDGSDVVAMARTGSGKTAAFLLPALEKLKAHSSVVGARVLVLSPTRELALQTLKFTKELGKFTDVRAALLLGGDSMEEQFSALHGNPDIIIATPGRFLHVVVEMDLKLSSVEYVVFDEADRLFEMGFSDQLQEILRRLPETRQTLLFSATLPKTLVEFAKAGLKDPVLVRLDVDSKLSQQLKLSFLSIREHSKPCLLLYLLREVVKPSEQTVVFVASKHHVEFLKELLTQTGFEASYLYSSLDPAARKINAAKFTTKRVNILIVTDVAARGIDIPMLDNVINYNFPSKPKLFVHRVGRVARAGRSGTAHSLVAPDEVPYLLDLHLFLGRSLTTTSDDGDVYGSVPQAVLDEEDGIIKRVLETSSDLEALRRVADNGLKQYVRSRPAPSLDSVRRSKEVETPPVHPLFKKSLSVPEVQQLSLLQGIKGYKPNQTIFEVSMRSGSNAVQVMQQKRSYHGNVIAKIQQKKAAVEDDDQTSERGVADGWSQEQSTESDLKVFVSLSTWQATHQKGSKRGKRTQEREKDENYISYTASDSHSEKGLSLGLTGFNQQASGAVLDLTADDDEGLKKNKGGKKWDRKRKKFVGESGDSKSKKIKTEAGTRINASYKSNFYKEWRTKNKVDAVVVGSEESKSEAPRPSGLSHVKRRRGGRRWHTQGDEATGGKVKGQGGGRLRKPEEIVKLRKRQKWQKFRSMPKTKRRQFLKQNRKQQKQPTARGKTKRK